MNDREVSRNYEILGFVKGLYDASYVNLRLAEGVRIPFEEYMGEEDVKRYRELLNEGQYRLEELSDMLEMMDGKMEEEKEGKE